MHITLEQLRFCRSILDANDLADIAKEAGRTTTLVRSVLAACRANDTIEFLCYERAKAKAQQMLVIADAIERQNSQTLKAYKMTIPTLNLNFANDGTE